MREYYFKKTIGLTEGDLFDILCACVEGGSNYWAQIQNEGEQWDEVEQKLPADHTIENHIMAMWDEGYDLVIRDVEDDVLHCISFERLV